MLMYCLAKKETLFQLNCLPFKWILVFSHCSSSSFQWASLYKYKLYCYRII